MAIAFARPEYVSRSSGKNVCLKGAYNARTIVKDMQNGVVYNFQSRKDNVYHEILLPEHVNQKFKDISLFTNAIESSEKRKDSQLCVEWVIALPKEEEITLDMKKEIIREFVERKGWIREGLGVQIDIHKPHAGDVNWHAHLLVTTRRFSKDGLGFESKKARDLQPKVLNGYVQKSIDIDNHNFYRKVLEDKIKEWGVDLRVISTYTRLKKEKILIKFKHLNSAQYTLSLMGKVRNIFAVNVGRYTKTAPEQRIAFASAKSIWDEAAQRLLAA